MKARTLKLKTLAIASAVTIAGCSLSLAPGNYVIAAEAPVVTQQVAKMTNAQLYAGLEITQDPRYICVNNEAWGTDTAYYLPNRAGYVLDVVSAKTAEGKPVSYKFFSPLELTKWDSKPGLIQHTGGPAGQAAVYSLRVWPEATSTLNEAEFQSQLLQCQQVGYVNNTYVDWVDEGNTIRGIFNYTITYAVDGSVAKGYIGYVQDKTTGKYVSYCYEESADVYDDTRALTVAYSVLPQ